MNVQRCSFEVFDMSELEDVKTIGATVFDAHLMANDLCLLEYNACDVTSAQINAYVKAAHARLGRNSILGVLMCSQENCILYLGVKT